MVGKVMAFAMTIMMLGGTISQFVVGRLFNVFSNNLALAGLIFPILVLIFAFTTVIKGGKET